MGLNSPYFNHESARQDQGSECCRAAGERTRVGAATVVIDQPADIHR
jgi:hypothetical protein